jgi:hypothetical protein
MRERNASADKTATSASVLRWFGNAAPLAVVG